MTDYAVSTTIVPTEVTVDKKKVCIKGRLADLPDQSTSEKILGLGALDPKNAAFCRSFESKLQAGDYANQMARNVDRAHVAAATGKKDKVTYQIADPKQTHIDYSVTALPDNMATAMPNSVLASAYRFKAMIKRAVTFPLRGYRAEKSEEN